MLTATTTTHAVIRSAKGALGIHAEARGHVACLEREDAGDRSDAAVCKRVSSFVTDDNATRDD